MTKSLDEKIFEIGGECPGVFSAMLSSRNALGDETIDQFIAMVQEKNSKLWERFIKYKETVPENFGFKHFILSVVLLPMPV